MQKHETSIDPIAGPDEQLKNLFTLSYPQLSQAVYDRHPQMQAPFHGELMARLAALLPTYNGQVTETDLMDWAELQERTDPGVFLLCLHADCLPFVRSAIWKTIEHAQEPSKFDDDPELVRELIQDAWIWAIEHLEELMVPGSAKSSTRMYEAACYVALAWLKKQRTRRAAVIRKMYELPSKTAAEKRALELDEQVKQKAIEARESKEIQGEMEAVLAAD